MHPALTIQTPPAIATEAFTDAAAAVGRLEEIYERNTRFLRDRFEAYINGEAPNARVRASYPFVRMTTATYARLDSRLAYGFVARPDGDISWVTFKEDLEKYVHGWTHEVDTAIYGRATCRD